MRNVTYAQLDRLLAALGFQLASEKDPRRVYEHRPSGAMFVLAKRPPTDTVANADLHSTGRHLVEWGFLDDDAFEEFASTGAISVSK
jgi:hypothetical protein